MKRIATLLLLSAAATGQAFACGEGVFHMGEGLQFQGYLAPRPATIVVFESGGPPPESRVRVYRGLSSAGHRLMVARTEAELAQALAGHPVDVVIAGAGSLDAAIAGLSAADAGPRLLPVVERGGRDGLPAQARGVWVHDGASLSQYLRAIHRLGRD